MAGNTVKDSLDEIWKSYTVVFFFFLRQERVLSTWCPRASWRPTLAASLSRKNLRWKIKLTPCEDKSIWGSLVDWFQQARVESENIDKVDSFIHIFHGFKILVIRLSTTNYFLYNNRIFTCMFFIDTNFLFSVYFFITYWTSSFM